MLFPNNFEQKIGFDKIRLLIEGQTISPLGKEKMEKIEFSTEPQWIEEELAKTKEFLMLLEKEEDFSMGTFFDLRSSLLRVRIVGTFLEEEEMWDLLRSLETARDLIVYFSKEECPYTYLKEKSREVPIQTPIIKRISNILDKTGKIKDNASPELLSIRQSLQKISSSISRTLFRVLQQAQAEGIVEKDTSPSVRDGRLVIPIAPMYKRKFNGIVHDSSSTGKTIYIEPAEVVELNNRIRELESEERREIVRILTSLTDEIRPLLNEINFTFDYLADLDFLQAKAHFAQKIEGNIPKIVPYPMIDWVKSIHPLLFLFHKKLGEKVVPLDIQLNKEQRIIIISGPNAGGKSVCLKTLGLLQYMIQCGVPVPLQSNSVAGCFENIVIDIGDEQSIENDLSTYSSHLKAMKQFLKLANSETLLLIDEFGSGTEPNIGGAIAEALLDEFNLSGAMGVITTHYQNLKNYAESHEGIKNGAMLYDRGRLAPLFVLSVGNPGSSFAIEIARKIGLPEKVIQRASDIVGQEYINMDKHLQDISRDKRYWENKRESIHKKEKEIDILEEEYQAQLKELSRLKKELNEKSKNDALQLLAEANGKIENTIRKIKESQAEKSTTREARKELEEFKNTLSNQEEQEEEQHIQKMMEKLRNRKRKKKKTSAPISPILPKKEPFKEGSNVKIKGQTAKGEILRIIGKTAEVSFGMMKSIMSLENLEHCNGDGNTSQNTKVSYMSSETISSMHTKRIHFQQELDIRGRRADEALQILVSFIDDAIEVGATKVKILHGTGTGALREVTRNYLKKIHEVKDYHDEHVQLGGAGITIVEFE